MYLSLDEYPKNFGGSATKIGTPVDSVQNRLNITNITGSVQYPRPHSSTPVKNTTTQKVLDASSEFAYDNPRPLIKGHTRLLNNGFIGFDLGSTGRKNTNITSGIHPMISNINRLDTTAIRNKEYNMYTGKFTGGGSPGIYHDNFGFDTAAFVSRTNPGTISFKIPRSTVSKNYKPKNG